MKNVSIREAAAQNRVKLWEIAEALDISDANFSRKLRTEFSEEEKKKILDIIKRIREEADT